MPYNLEAEQSVLGGILIDPNCLSTVLERLKPEHFYNPQHREIYACIIRMFTAGEPIDFVTLLNEVCDRQIFETKDQAKIYLTNIAQMVPSLSNMETYARIIEEKYYLRTLLYTARDIIDTTSEGEQDAKMLLDIAEQKIFDIRQGRTTQGPQRIDGIIIDTFDSLQQISGDDKQAFTGLSTGFSAVDSLIFGLNKSDLILLAARPAMGKTSFALNIATNVANRSDKAVVIFSLEMSKEQLVSRVLSSEASISNSAFRTGDLTGQEWANLVAVAEHLSQKEIYIDDSSGITVPEMKARLRRIKNLGLVVIDYLQLMTSGRRIESRVAEVSEITRSLKIMAKELDVPIITLSQLSRGPESRPDKRPMLSDLRESGSIEQDADIVMFLYRDEYYNRDTEDVNIAECIVAKNRHGEVDTVKLSWDGSYTRFASLETYRDAP
ncbi:replicative DNA helicase [Bittarella massiliensis]|nr:MULTISPECIES: replicative DNA helicase [Eubacteriales]MBC2872032.1 replicative DNA helicase [Bittarella massiliensis (ex Durand et al. 2017)]MCQ4950436.1 replicative DNA helicase [Bittarella massiliensis (ex Durand et al. 2017)]MZL70884.1 replicative DNA helicase [Bittarella massiliensis (ex Durand et al. 2017)]MZL81028.1 replicative DNA helicase [Bittarella massiliensis (ex Durand et al. 2017)]